MKPIFEQHLRQYGELAKEAGKEVLTPEEQGKIQHVMDYHISKGAKRFATTEDAQKRIFGLQMEKQSIMDDLQSGLRGLDAPVVSEAKGREMTQKEKWEMQAKQVRYVGDDPMGRGGYELGSGKKKQTLTLGEVLTDGAWGLEHRLDPETVPKHVRKKYLVEQAKQKLNALVDRQIIMNEMSSSYTPPMREEAFRALEDMAKDEKGLEKSAGHIAEKMVSNLLKKSSYEADAGFRIEDGDAYQDVTQKIDFVIKVPDRNRGVGVEADERMTTIGVQFTTSANQGTMRHKEQQISDSKRRLTAEDRIDDIVLMAMPLKNVQDLYRQWQNNKTPGGPDKLMSKAQKLAILRGILKDLVPEEKIAEMADKV